MARAHCMAVAYDPITNTVLTSATVNVYNNGTVTPISATIYDKSGNVLSNPLTSDATTGLIDFYLNVPQDVDLLISKASFASRTYSNVQVIDDPSNAMTSVLTTTGDMVYASSANAPTRLSIGSANNLLTVSGGIPAWTASPSVTTLTTSGLVTAGNGLVVTAGNAAVNSSVVTNIGLAVAGTMSGSVGEYGIVVNATADSSATTTAAGINVNMSTANSAFTCMNLASILVAPVIKGAASTVTSAYGLLVQQQNATCTNAYGIYITAPTGGSSINYGLYNGGSSVLAGGISGNTTMLGTAAGQGIVANDSTNQLVFQNSQSIANNANAQLVLGSAAPVAIVLICTDTGHAAVVATAGASHTTVILAQDSTAFSTTLGHAATYNVCWDTVSKYIIENKSGGTINYRGLTFAGG